VSRPVQNSSWATVRFKSRAALAGEAAEGTDVVLISTHFDPAARRAVVPPRPEALSDDSMALLEEAARVLRCGGVLFIYGTPRELASWGNRLDGRQSQQARMVFKYWIALELDTTPRGACLQPAHLGLLLFQKMPLARRAPQPSPLDVSQVRVPHQRCAACGQTLKDWGGKKHQMHPAGAALSDVWRDLPRLPVQEHVAPAAVLARVAALTPRAARRLHLVQCHPAVCARGETGRDSLLLTPRPTGQPLRWRRLRPNTVYEADCVAFLNRVIQVHPEGAFDLVVADPPYNLEKRYDTYTDALAERHYLAWCEQWLDGLARALKPGGSLFVLNLPRWAMHHAAFLNARLEFRHWIAWDALSEPRGRLMPAHYALLYYTKPGRPPVFNYTPLEALAAARTAPPTPGHGAAPDRIPVAPPAAQATDPVLPPDAPWYCLRAKCLRNRKAAGDDARVELSDVWSDIHRIKHKRDRDAHPCQLPEKLLERIIRLTTRPGDLVFDPFGGTGTTAVAAHKLGRRFVLVELDRTYVQLTRAKLAAMRQAAMHSGVPIVPRQCTTRPRGQPVSKRAVELALQALAKQLGRVPTEADLPAELRDKIALLYPYPGAALKRAKVALSG